MPSPARLMATGLAAGPATLLGQNRSGALIATGSTKATALVLVAQVNFFTVTSASTGALLPPADTSPEIAIYNGGANALSVYANGTDVINALSAGAAFSVTNGKSAIFVPAGIKWVATLSA